MIILFSIQFLTILFLGYKLHKSNTENIVKKLEEDKIILSKPIGLAEFKKVDPNYSLLKDVIESIKLEKWKVIKFEKDYDTYDIELSNHNSSLKTRCRIRTCNSGLYLSWFHLFKMIDSNSHSHRVSYNNEESAAKYLILELMWSYVLDHHQEVYNKDIEYFEACKQSISNELKTLKRDKNLSKILDY